MIVSIARKLSTTEEQHLDQICLSEEITETKATTMKICPSSSPGEDGFCNLKTKHSKE
jgi:hypothetical protein